MREKSDHATIRWRMLNNITQLRCIFWYEWMQFGQMQRLGQLLLVTAAGDDDQLCTLNSVQHCTASVCRNSTEPFALFARLNVSNSEILFPLSMNKKNCRSVCTLQLHFYYMKIDQICHTFCNMNTTTKSLLLKKKFKKKTEMKNKESEREKCCYLFFISSCISLVVRKNWYLCAWTWQHRIFLPLRHIERKKTVNS